MTPAARTPAAGVASPSPWQRTGAARERRLLATVESIPGRVVATFVELHRRNADLSVLGWLLIAGLIVASAAFIVDDRTVAGVSVWLKPMKFALSIAIYLWTLGWLLFHLRSRRAEITGRVIAFVMVLEFLLIFSQSARGTASHFNSATPYDVAVYRTMGVLILVNTVAVGFAAVLYFRSRPLLPAAYLLGIRLGLLLFLFSAVSGGIMIGIVSHSVGAGDLRIAHFIAMHTLQAVPLAGFATHRLHERGLLRNPSAWTGGFALLALLLHKSALLLALAGKSPG
jgi:hypothetical protein